MNIIKRSGAQVLYEGEKITTAIKKANMTVPENERLSDAYIEAIEHDVRNEGEKLSRALGVEEIHDMVESEIMKETTSSTDTFVRWQEKQTQQTKEFFLSLIARTKKLNRKTQTRTLPLIAFKETIWLVKSAETLPTVFFFPRI